MEIGSRDLTYILRGLADFALLVPRNSGLILHLGTGERFWSVPPQPVMEIEQRDLTYLLHGLADLALLLPRNSDLLRDLGTGEKHQSASSYLGKM